MFQVITCRQDDTPISINGHNPGKESRIKEMVLQVQENLYLSPYIIIFPKFYADYKILIWRVTIQRVITIVVHLFTLQGVAGQAVAEPPHWQLTTCRCFSQWKIIRLIKVHLFKISKQQNNQQA